MGEGEIIGFLVSLVVVAGVAYEFGVEKGFQRGRCPDLLGSPGPSFDWRALATKMEREKREEERREADKHRG